MNDKKVLKTKVAIEWYFASWYFQLFPYMIKGEVFADERFEAIYNEMTEYINGKIEPCTEGDIIDTYVIIEQQAE